MLCIALYHLSLFINCFGLPFYLIQCCLPNVFSMWLFISCRYNFGTSPELLFKPCKPSDSEDEGGQGSLGEADGGADGDDQCYIGAEGRFYAYDPVIRLIPLEGGKSRSASQSPSQPSASGEAEKEDVKMLQDKKVELLVQPEAPHDAKSRADDAVKEVEVEVVTEEQALRMKLTYNI